MQAGDAGGVGWFADYGFLVVFSVVLGWSYWLMFVVGEEGWAWFLLGMRPAR